MIITRCVRVSPKSAEVYQCAPLRFKLIAPLGWRAERPISAAAFLLWVLCLRAPSLREPPRKNPKCPQHHALVRRSGSQETSTAPVPGSSSSCHCLPRADPNRLSHPKALCATHGCEATTMASLLAFIVIPTCGVEMFNSHQYKRFKTTSSSIACFTWIWRSPLQMISHSNFSKFLQRIKNQQFSPLCQSCHYQSVSKIEFRLTVCIFTAMLRAKGLVCIILTAPSTQVVIQKLWNHEYSQDFFKG